MLGMLNGFSCHQRVNSVFFTAGSSVRFSTVVFYLFLKEQASTTYNCCTGRLPVGSLYQNQVGLPVVLTTTVLLVLASRTGSVDDTDDGQK